MSFINENSPQAVQHKSWNWRIVDGATPAPPPLAGNFVMLGNAAGLDPNFFRPVNLSIWSADGTSWAAASNPIVPFSFPDEPAFQNEQQFVAFNGVYHVASGSSTGTAISTDGGVTWSLPSPFSVQFPVWFAAANVWVGSNGPGSTSFFTSPDFINWTTHALPGGVSWTGEFYVDNIGARVFATEVPTAFISPLTGKLGVINNVFGTSVINLGTDQQITSVVRQAPTLPGSTLWAGGFPAPTGPAQLYRSDDDGATWTTVYTTTTGFDFYGNLIFADNVAVFAFLGSSRSYTHHVFGSGVFTEGIFPGASTSGCRGCVERFGDWWANQRSGEFLKSTNNGTTWVQVAFNGFPPPVGWRGLA